MAIPETPILDDFNRANENPLSGGGNWASRGTSNQLQLLSNAVTGTTTAALSSDYWTPATFGPDCEAYFTVSALNASTANYIRIYLRLANPGTGTESGYVVQWSNDANGCRIFKETAREAFTQIAQAASARYAAGDVVTFRAQGSTLTVYKNGVSVLTVSDGTFTAAGSLAIGGKDGTFRLDDFGGGTLGLLSLPFIASTTQVYTPALVGVEALPFIASVTAVYGLTVLATEVDVPFIGSVTVVHAPSLVGIQALPFISSVTVVYAPALEHAEIDLPFIASQTRVFGIFSLFNPAATFSGAGNGGELFPVRLAPNGTTETATLAANIASTDTLLELTGDGSLPSSEPFVLTIDDEVIYLVQITSGSYRVRGRGLSNTTAAAHLAGATVTWSDSYDMAIPAGFDIAASFTADINSTGTFTYLGSLICPDATQAYLAGARYPMHVTSVLGVFDAGAGSAGTNRCDAAQPNVIATPTGVSDDCPVALANPTFVTSDISAGDIALVRYTNPEAVVLDLGPRIAFPEAWFGLVRLEPDGSVNNADTDGICVDTTGGEGTYTAAVNAVFDNPSSIGIAPSTGDPTTTAVPYATATLPGADRDFTVSAKSGWPIGVLAVRQGNRRVPLWESYDWHNFSFGFTGFGLDALFAQLVINRNGVTGVEPEAALPGPQDITGPDAVWDDGSYRFAVAWYVAIFGTPYLVVGPTIGGGGGPTLGPGGGGFVPTVTFSGGTPTITLPTVPDVEGGSGGDISGATGQRFNAALV